MPLFTSSTSCLFPVVPSAAINELGDALLRGKHVGTRSSFVLNNCSCNRLPPFRSFWTLCKLLDCSLHKHSYVSSSYHGLVHRGSCISSPQLLHCSDCLSHVRFRKATGDLAIRRGAGDPARSGKEGRARPRRRGLQVSGPQPQLWITSEKTHTRPHHPPSAAPGGKQMLGSG